MAICVSRSTVQLRNAGSSGCRRQPCCSGPIVGPVVGGAGSVARERSWGCYRGEAASGGASFPGRRAPLGSGRAVRSGGLVTDRKKFDVSDNLPHDKRSTGSVSESESENPQIPSPTPTTARPRTNQDWWPNQLDLSVLHANSPQADPMGSDYDYAAEFRTLDLEALRRDVVEVLTTRQEWWPPDHG